MKNGENSVKSSYYVDSRGHAIKEASDNRPANALWKVSDKAFIRKLLQYLDFGKSKLA